MSPKDQECKHLSRQRVYSLDFEVEWGFWSSSNGMTMAAFSTTGSLNGVHIAHKYTCIRTHVRARGRSRTVLANTRKCKCTRTQINARKLVVAMDTWVISAGKRDCDLRVRSKTLRMYYICGMCSISIRLKYTGFLSSPFGKVK